MATRKSPEAANAHALSIVAEPGKPTLVLTRVFNAPRRLVFEAHAKPEHVWRWWGLRTHTMSACEVDPWTARELSRDDVRAPAACRDGGGPFDVTVEPGFEPSQGARRSQGRCDSWS